MSFITVLFNVWLNIDRAAASLFGARSPEETVSSEIGRHESNPVVEEAADALDAISPGHVERAVANADRLESAK